MRNPFVYLTPVVIAWIVLLTGALALWHQVNAPVQKVVIHGQLTAAQRSHVEQLLNGLAGEEILSLDLPAVAKQLDALPWSHSVVVRRHWPDEIDVRFRLAVPIARWGTDRFLSASGQVVEWRENTGADLPLFQVAVTSPEETLDTYRLVDQIVRREGFVIRELAENALGEWRVLLAGAAANKQLEVALGAGDVNRRINRFLGYYRSVSNAQQATMRYVDTRYPNGIAVRHAIEEAGGLLAETTVPVMTKAREDKSEVYGGN